MLTVGIMTRLDKLEENQEMTINMLRTALSKIGYEDEDADGEIFPTSLNTMQELNDVEKKLIQEQAFRRKMVILDYV